MRRSLSSLLLLAVLCACGGDAADEPVPADGEAATARESLPTDTAPGMATAMGTGDATLPDDVLERDRMDGSWRRFASRSSGADSPPGEPGGEAPAGDASDGGAAAPDTTESWEDIAPDAVSAGGVSLPLHGDVAGPSVLAVQILLDRALLRPGVLDGRWGKNTEKAVWWFQDSEGLNATGRVDEETLGRLRQRAGDPGALIVERQLTEEDVSGPFVDIPSDVYDKADMECLCYESRAEQLAERFHTTPDLLRNLNPGVDLDALSTGDRLHVPDVHPFSIDGTSTPPGTRGQVAEIVISDGGHWVHALDADGGLLYHFPSTLGSDYAPSPSGEYSVDSIHQDPSWHYKPDLLTGVDPSEPDAVLPAGPNNAVGVVWMQLSKPHYGIHGTSAPETIGYVTSHGCVRLTNWDAELLSHVADAGIPVRFVDGRQRTAQDGRQGS